MSVEIDPSELGFRRPFTVEVAQVLKIRNTNNAPVAFKVKTTAPKQYCVRPNSGRIEAGHEVEVSVLLQAMKQEPPVDAKCRDKFLVQSVTITGDLEFSSVSQIWDAVEKSAVQERKIRVAWLPPLEEGRLHPASTPSRRPVSNGFEATPDNTQANYSSPNEDNTLLDDSTAPVSPPETKEAKQEPSPTQPSNIFSSNAPAAVAATVKTAATETYEDLKAQLAKAEATIVSLKNEAASGLRQRKTAEPDTKQQEQQQQQKQKQQQQPQQQGTEGVPVQIVALLCLASFLLAYFFF